jgi:hypothetical protein
MLARLLPAAFVLILLGGAGEVWARAAAASAGAWVEQSQERTAGKGIIKSSSSTLARIVVVYDEKTSDAEANQVSQQLETIVAKPGRPELARGANSEEQRNLSTLLNEETKHMRGVVVVKANGAAPPPAPQHLQCHCYWKKAGAYYVFVCDPPCSGITFNGLPSNPNARTIVALVGQGAAGAVRALKANAQGFELGSKWWEDEVAAKFRSAPTSTNLTIKTKSSPP